ncbi:CLUMA_CG003668, isoform A [Clunio marinus]|uniref:CLUMA_CG003668, isoform A n=1 Tax=Clunio marinus TaxID=568069 RepID=A0A1J1HPP7_9DIPT|nr:CLUMA_CG003668, isoform A [Clunio marinus]
MQFGNLEQLNNIRSDQSGHNLLDLVFSNLPIAIERSDDPLSKVDDFHPPITGTFNLEITNEKFKSHTYRNFKKVNWKLIIEDLSAINWSLIFSESKDVDEKVKKFYETIDNLLDTHCPKITAKPKHFPCWFSIETIRLLKKKHEINYDDIEKLLKIENLESRRKLADVKFITKSFNDQIDSCTFLHHFKFTQDSATRNQKVFKTTQSRTDIGKYSVFNRLMLTYNTLFDDRIALSHQPTDAKLKQIIREKSDTLNHSNV